MLVFAFAATQEVKNVPIAVLEPGLGHRRVATSSPGSRARRTSPASSTFAADADIAPAIDSRSVL